MALGRMEAGSILSIHSNELDLDKEISIPNSTYLPHTCIGPIDDDLIRPSASP